MKSIFYPRPSVDATASAVVGQAGGILLTETIAATGLAAALREQLGPWMKPMAVHEPAKVVLDLAMTLALGGDTLADAAVLRGSSQIYGRVASDPTISRTIAALASDGPAAINAINAARALARAKAWELAGAHAPDHGLDAKNPLIIDLDATLITAHSDKDEAAPTFKRGFGFHPLCAFVDHGASGTGEPLAVLLRAGNAGSNTADDHITVIKDALTQLPGVQVGKRAGQKILIRTDGAGATKALITWINGQRMTYSLGFTLPDNTPELLAAIPKEVWVPAIDGQGLIRDGAWVAEITDLMDLTKWPAGMRVIVRKERPHPGAQLRFDDVDGMRITAFVTNTKIGQLAALELRHRRRARCEDRIRIAKDTGLRNLPLKGFNQNKIWCAIVALAMEITAWMQMLGLTEHEARRWEPKRLRLRLFSIPAAIARTGRRTWLRLAKDAPWVDVAIEGITRLRKLPAPG